MAANSENLPDHHILALPAELRIKIYEFLFDLRVDKGRSSYHGEQNRNFDLSAFPSGLCNLQLSAGGVVSSCSLGQSRLASSPLLHYGAILQANKLIYREACDILYSRTLFRIQCGEDPGSRRLLAASRWSCFNYRKESISSPTMRRRIQRIQSANVSMRFEQEDALIDHLPAIKFLFAKLGRDSQDTAACRNVTITLVGWLPTYIEDVDQVTWLGILDALRNVHFGCVPAIEVKLAEFQDVGDVLHSRFQEFAAAAQGILPDCNQR